MQRDPLGEEIPLKKRKKKKSSPSAGNGGKRANLNPYCTFLYYYDLLMSFLKELPRLKAENVYSQFIVPPVNLLNKDVDFMRTLFVDLSHSKFIGNIAALTTIKWVMIHSRDLERVANETPESLPFTVTYFPYAINQYRIFITTRKYHTDDFVEEILRGMTFLLPEEKSIIGSLYYESVQRFVETESMRYENVHGKKFDPSKLLANQIFKKSLLFVTMVSVLFTTGGFGKLKIKLILKDLLKIRFQDGVKCIEFFVREMLEYHSDYDDMKVDQIPDPEEDIRIYSNKRFNLFGNNDVLLISLKKYMKYLEEKFYNYFLFLDEVAEVPVLPPPPALPPLPQPQQAQEKPQQQQQLQEQEQIQPPPPPPQQQQEQPKPQERTPPPPPPQQQQQQSVDSSIVPPPPPPLPRTPPRQRNRSIATNPLLLKKCYMLSHQKVQQLVYSLTFGEERDINRICECIVYVIQYQTDVKITYLDHVMLCATYIILNKFKKNSGITFKDIIVHYTHVSESLYLKTPIELNKILFRVPKYKNVIQYYNKFFIHAIKNFIFLPNQKEVDQKNEISKQIETRIAPFSPKKKKRLYNTNLFLSPRTFSIKSPLTPRTKKLFSFGKFMIKKKFDESQIPASKLNIPINIPLPPPSLSSPMSHSSQPDSVTEDEDEIDEDEDELDDDFDEMGGSDSPSDSDSQKHKKKSKKDGYEEPKKKSKRKGRKNLTLDMIADSSEDEEEEEEEVKSPVRESGKKRKRAEFSPPRLSRKKKKRKLQ